MNTARTEPSGAQQVLTGRTRRVFPYVRCVGSLKDTCFAPLFLPFDSFVVSIPFTFGPSYSQRVTPHCQDFSTGCVLQSFVVCACVSEIKGENN